MISLPTEKSPPGFAPERAKVLLYGPPKIGKTTLASQFDPEHTLFLACEEGLDALEVFKVSVASWEDFRQVGAALIQDPKHFKTIVIDTVNELHRMCAESVCSNLGIKHASEASHGKGWGGINDEWRLRVGRLANLGLGVWFVSHSKDVEIETRTSKMTKAVPTISGQPRDYLIGLVDQILYATSYEGKEGTVRQLRTAANEAHEAGGRVTLTDPLPLDAKALRDDMERAASLLVSGSKVSTKTKAAAA